MSFEDLKIFDKRSGKLQKHALCQKRYYARVRGDVIRELGGKCVHCGGMENLEIHEVSPCLLGRGKRHGAETIRRWHEGLETGNLKLVCTGCHVNYEHNGNTNSLKEMNRRS